MSKAKAPKVEESELDKELARVAAERWGHYKENYRDVETSYREAIGQDTSGLLRGRATADVAQARTGAVGQALAASRGNAAALAPSFASLGQARTRGATGANAAAEGQRSKLQAGFIALGNDMATDAQSALASTARSSNQEAINLANTQTRSSIARLGALETMASGAMSAYGARKQYLADAAQADAYNKWAQALNERGD
jgi:hypothetical protein